MECGKDSACQLWRISKGSSVIGQPSEKTRFLRNNLQKSVSDRLLIHQTRPPDNWKHIYFTSKNLTENIVLINFCQIIFLLKKLDWRVHCLYLWYSWIQNYLSFFFFESRKANTSILSHLQYSIKCSYTIYIMHS